MESLAQRNKEGAARCGCGPLPGTASEIQKGSDTPGPQVGDRLHAVLKLKRSFSDNTWIRFKSHLSTTEGLKTQSVPIVAH